MNTDILLIIVNKRDIGNNKESQKKTQGLERIKGYTQTCLPQVKQA